jgi:hypothetical protein
MVHPAQQLLPSSPKLDLSRGFVDLEVAVRGHIEPFHALPLYTSLLWHRHEVVERDLARHGGVGVPRQRPAKVKFTEFGVNLRTLIGISVKPLDQLVNS